MYILMFILLDSEEEDRQILSWMLWTTLCKVLTEDLLLELI